VAPRLDRFTFLVGPAGGVDHVQDYVGGGEFVEKLVAQATALVGTRDQTGHVEQFHGDVALACPTVLVATALFPGETRTLRPDVAHPPVRVDGRKGVVSHVDVGLGRGLVERRLAGVWLARQGDREHAISYRGQ